jgi:GBP family porin
MKKTLLAVALAAGFSAAAHAQSANVSLYGVVDTFLEFNSGGTESRSAVQSGGMSGSRWGIKGSEDLGGGLKANVKLESGYFVDTGSSAQGGLLFGRQAFVGLSGGFGSVNVGRQYSPFFDVVNIGDAFETGYASPYSNGSIYTAVRVNNAIRYDSPNLSGFTGSLMWGANETAGKSGDGLMNVAVQYAGGPIAAGFSYVDDKLTVGTETKAYTLQGSYDLSVARVYAGYVHAKFDSATDLTNDGYHVGTQIKAGGGAVWAQFASGKLKEVSNSTSQTISLGYNYNLSARTNVYAMFQYTKNDSAAAFGTGAANSANDYTSVLAGQDPKGLALGIRHAF